MKIFHKVFLIFLILNYKNVSCLSETEKDLIWKSLVNGDFYKNRRNTDNDSVELNSSIESNKIFSTQILNNNNNNREMALELLKDADPFVSLKLGRNDLLLRKNKYGSEIIEDPNHEVLRNSPLPGQISLIIVFDGTGSMYNDLNQLVEGAESIVAEMTNKKNNLIYNYIFVPYRDPYIGPKLVTQNLDKFLNEIRNLPIFGGGDCPESAIGGIQLALESALPYSFVFVFTDATARDFNIDEPTINLIQKHQATITFLLTGYCGPKATEEYQAFEKLASISNGQIYNLEKTDIKEVLGGIRKTLDSKFTSLHYFHSNESGSHSFDVDIDKNLKELTISVAGKNPNVNIKDPNFKEPDNGLEEILNLNNLKVINIPEPIPGKWNVKTVTDSEYSIKLTALSNLKFKFGFYTDIPDQILDNINIRPILSMKNFLAISASDDNLISNLTSIEISFFSNENNSNLILPLEQSGYDLHSNKSIYVTTPFEPPEGMFKIYINGYDFSGNPLKYLLSTAIRTLKKDSPKIINVKNFIELNEGDSSYIECKIDSSDLVNMVWVKNNKFIEGIKYTDNLYRLEFNPAEINDSGIYLCIVENENGYDESVINLIVKPKLVELKVNMMKKEMFAKENDKNYQISCAIESNNSVNVEWYLNGAPIKNDKYIQIENENLVISSVKRHHTGNYTCSASENERINEDSGYLNVFFEPLIINPENEVIWVPFETDIELNCQVVGNPKPNIEWIPSEDSMNNFEFGKIVNFKVQNEGIYFCRALNGIGDIKEKKFQLLGKSIEPPKILNPEYTTILANIGDTLNLTCECDLCEPITNASWLKNTSKNGFEELKYLTTNNRNNTHKIFKSIFTKSMISYNDKGHYSCMLANEYGQSKKEFQINILSAPLISRIRVVGDYMKISNVSTTIMEGSTIQLNCELFESYPTPHIQWLKNGKIISDDETIQNSLILLNVKYETDDANYKCLAKNIKGEDSNEIYIHVFAAPTIVSSLHSVLILDEGINISFECDIIGNPKPIINWKYFNKSIDERIDHYSFDENVLSFDAQFADNGIYECEGINEFGSIKKTLTLVVYVPPRILGTSEEILSVGAGNEIILSCPVYSYPSSYIEWTFDDDEVELSNDIEIENNELVIMNANLSNEGSYRCEASNEHGTATKYFYLSVNFPPNIISNLPTEPIKLYPNTNITLTCAADGKPRPDVFWNKNGDRISKIEYGSSVITIENMGLNITDKYSCIAHNSEGLDEMDIEIIALVVPRINKRYHVTENTLINSTMNQAVILICPIDNADHFTWKKNDVLLKNSNEQTLKLINLSYRDNGKYTCTGVNQVGYENFEQNLLVYGKPHIFNSIEQNSNEENIREIFVKIGDNKTLSCLTQGFPQPTIEWTKEETIIASNEIQYNLINVNIGHDGIYKCKAMNQYGTEEYTYIVRVLVPPKTELPKNNYIEISEGENLRLFCEIHGNPKLLFHWTKNNNNLIDEQQDILKITNATYKDRGSYKCSATNILGTEDVIYIVEILTVPKFLNDSMKNKLKILNTQILELSCSAVGNPVPIIVWTYNNKKLISSSRTTLTNPFTENYIDQYGNSFKNKSNGFSKNMELYGKIERNNNVVTLKLLIISEKMKRNGKYSCHAINSLGSKEYQINVEIFGLPKLEDSFDKIAEEKILLEGLPLILFCPWLGNPKPNIIWRKNGQALIDEPKLSITNDKTTLTIFESEFDDSGNYTCLGKNIVGENKKEFKVDVRGTPKFKFSQNVLTNSHLVLKKYPGQKLTLECPAIGNPKPRIYWLRESLKNKTEILSEMGSSLDLNNIEETDGLYKCYVNNSLGFLEKRFSIDILKFPKILNNNNAATVRELETIILNCSATGNPQPKLTWLKDGKIFSITPPGFLSNNSQILKIINADKDSGGIYTCAAENILGKTDINIRVNILPLYEWTDWSNWSDCSVSCGIGIRIRNRKCLTFRNELSKNCSGNSSETKACEMPPCPIDGNWGDWSSWSNCSHQCWNKELLEKPKRARSRACNNPKPKFGGKNCIGRHLEQVECNTEPCPIDGDWSEWEPWSACNVSCGIGIKERHRICNNPEPRYNGKYCSGSPKETLVCITEACLTDVGWSNWSPWSACSETCGGNGIRKRTRFCNNNSIFNKKHYCVGPNIEVIKCQKQESCEITDIDDYGDLNEEEMKILLSEVQNHNPKVKSNTKLRYEDNNVSKFSPNNDEVIKIIHNTITSQPEFAMQITFKSYEAFKNFQEFSSKIYEPQLKNQMNQCPLGFQFIDEKCIDIDECQIHKICSENEVCKNSAGSFTCECSRDFVLNELTESCEPKTNNAKPFCIDGFESVNGTCKDIDECESLVHNCNVNQTCLNTISSYLCIPTPCPEPYEENESTNSSIIFRECILMCEKLQCTQKAKIAEIINYSILSLKSITDQPLTLLFVNHGLNQFPLPISVFEFESKLDVFELKILNQTHAHLYANDKIQHEKLYKINIYGKSYDRNKLEINYFIKFIIFLYVQ